jgi:hypothetical protein
MCTGLDTPKRRALFFWCLCVLATLAVGLIVVVAIELGTTTNSNNLPSVPDDSAEASAATAAPTVAPTVAPTQRPTDAPTASPSNEPSASPSSQPPTDAPTDAPTEYEEPPGYEVQTNTSVDTVPPLLVTACALIAVACLICCGHAIYRRNQRHKAVEWNRIVVPRPSHIDVQEVPQQSRPEPPVPPPNLSKWRLAPPVLEEDIDMDDMPQVTSVHYGLSPTDILEGDTYFGNPKKDDLEEDEDGDDTRATMVL